MSKQRFARKEVRDEARRLEAEGWLVEMRHPHAAVICPNCGVSAAGLPSTPRGGFWRAEVRRLVAKRRCAE